MASQEMSSPGSQSNSSVAALPASRLQTLVQVIEDASAIATASMSPQRAATIMEAASAAAVSSMQLTQDMVDVYNTAKASRPLNTQIQYANKQAEYLAWARGAFPGRMEA